LSRLLQLLPNGKSLERKRIPFILEGGEEGGDRCEGRRARGDDSGGFQVDEVRNFELFAIHGIFMVLCNVCLDQSLLIDVPCFGQSCADGRISRLSYLTSMKLQDVAALRQKL
jgi:hypothetical protein